MNNKIHLLLKWELFHQYRMQAQALVNRIDDRLNRLIETEEARPFTDYAFLNVAGDPSAKFLQRSPLSSYPVASAIPGLIGYFQVDAEGELSTPLLPRSTVSSSAYGLSQEELHQRERLFGQIQRILSENRLVAATKTAAADKAQDSMDQTDVGDVHAKSSQASTAVHGSSQHAFDQLKASPARRLDKPQMPSNSLGRVDELKLDYRYQKDSNAAMQGRSPPMGAAVPEKPMRKERSALPEPATSSVAEESEQSTRQKTKLRIRTFESDIDPFEISLLNSGQFVLYRKVWRDGQRYIQGALLERGKLLHDLIETPFQETGLSLMSDLILAYRDNVMSVFSNQAQESYLSRADELHGAVLLQTGLSAPFSDLELIFSVRQLPAGAGTPLIAWVSGVLLLVLCGGFYLIYRVAVQQIELVRQQQNFVSAVSHELKTPLTSIRMYGEILREGWASEEKKRIYYDYIHDESERLSRLIANVLQLARVNRNDLQINLRPIAVAHLMETVQAKILSQIERAGFALELNCDPQARRAMLAIDVDAFMQILINLVDNAIKFSAKSEKKRIELGCRLQRNATLVFSVRDHGPGVPREQMKKIFKLFYRSENELTRETLGTGIGLALVWQLTRSMNGWVEVVNQSPGAEFRLAFTALDDARE